MMDITRVADIRAVIGAVLQARADASADTATDSLLRIIADLLGRAEAAQSEEESFRKVGEAASPEAEPVREAAKSEEALEPSAATATAGAALAAGVWRTLSHEQVIDAVIALLAAEGPGSGKSHREVVDDLIAARGWTFADDKDHRTCLRKLSKACHGEVANRAAPRLAVHPDSTPGRLVYVLPDWPWAESHAAWKAKLEAKAGAGCAPAHPQPGGKRPTRWVQ